MYSTLPGWWEMLDRELPPGTEVKEKFGIARIESPVPPEVEERVERLSSQMCEICGDPGTLRTEDGWLQTRCDRCHNATHTERRILIRSKVEQSLRATDR